MTMESTGAVDAGTPLPRAAATSHPQPSAVPGPRSAARRRRKLPRRGGHAAALMTADGLATVAAAALAGGPGTVLLGVPPALLALVALHARGGLYRPAPQASALAELPRLLCGAVLAWSVATTVLAVAQPDFAVLGAGLPALIGLQVLLAGGGRAAVHLRRRRNNRRRPRSTLVVGTGRAARRVTAALYEHPEYGMRPVGLVATGAGDGGDAGDPDGPGDADEPFPVPVLGSAEDIARAVIQNAVRDAVLVRGAAPDGQTAGLRELFGELGCTVWLVDGGPCRGTAPAPAPPPAHLWGFACRRLDPPPRRLPARAAKRALDVAVAAVALVAAAPLLLACALAVRLVDGPGVVFRQERVGAAGRPFVMLKFRTLLPVDAHESATRWNVADDIRMSAVGRLLRRTSLDELPQLWNVLRGDMSLVGPRPERPYFVQKFSQSHAGYAARHRMPVGITGLAQVHGLRGDTSIEDRARFDNHYIETWSLWQDVLILLRTAGSVFRLGGS